MGQPSCCRLCGSCGRPGGLLAEGSADDTLGTSRCYSTLFPLWRPLGSPSHIYHSSCKVHWDMPSHRGHAACTARWCLGGAASAHGLCVFVVTCDVAFQLVPVFHLECAHLATERDGGPMLRVVREVLHTDVAKKLFPVNGHMLRYLHLLHYRCLGHPPWPSATRCPYVRQSNTMPNLQVAPLKETASSDVGSLSTPFHPASPCYSVHWSIVDPLLALFATGMASHPCCQQTISPTPSNGSRSVVPETMSNLRQGDGLEFIQVRQCRWLCSRHNVCL